MANATDNVYVNVIANTQGFTQKMNDALKPLRQFMQVIQTVMAAGGAVAIIQRIARAVGEMETAYAKLHPETQKAAGSLKDWNDTMARMKTEGGGVVAKVLTPIRQALLDIIDPAHQAKLAIQGVTEEVAGWAKYTSKETLAANQITAAKAALADALKAQKDLANQIAEYQRMITQLGKRPDFGTLTLKYQEKGYDSSYAQTRAAQDIAMYDQSIKFLSDTLKQLKIDLENANTALIEIPKWINENTKAADGNSDAIETQGMAYADLRDKLIRVEKALTDISNAENNLAKNGGAIDHINRLAKAASALSGGKGGASRPRPTVGRGPAAGDLGRTADDVADLTAEWQRYAEVMSIIATSMGEAFATGDYVEAIRQMTAALLNFIAKEAIAAALRIIAEQGTAGIPMAVALLALGGVAMIGGSAVGAMGSGGPGYGHTVPLPGMASGGIVTRPTLAMIGEAGPEAVVPLGRGVGGTTIIVQGSIWQTEDLAVAVARAQARW